MNKYERETTEIVRIAVRKEGVLIKTGVSFSIQRPTVRPTESSWVPSILTEDGETGIMIQDLPAGIYVIWTRVADEPEDIVDESGFIRIL